MTFTPWLAQAHEDVNRQIGDMPQWKQEALKRDEEYVLSSLGDCRFEAGDVRSKTSDE